MKEETRKDTHFNSLEKEIIDYLMDHEQEFNITETRFNKFSPIDILVALKNLESHEILIFDGPKVSIHNLGLMNIFKNRWKIYNRAMPWRSGLDD